MRAPKIGDLIDVRGIRCRIYALLPLGTIEAEAIDGSGRCYRVSGLPIEA